VSSGIAGFLHGRDQRSGGKIGRMPLAGRRNSGRAVPVLITTTLGGSGPTPRHMSFYALSRRKRSRAAATAS
jgi:hypothetical protein